eukprot:15477255-Alexandrium_andersonii.AAC.1
MRPYLQDDEVAVAALADDSGPRPEHPAPLPPQPPQRVWFKVLYTKAGLQKVVHIGCGVGRRLRSNDLVVSMHRDASQGQRVQCLAAARQLGTTASTEVGILSSLDMSSEALVAATSAWVSSGRGFFLRDVVPTAPVVEAVTALVNAGAVNSVDCPSELRVERYLQVAHGAQHAELLECLEWLASLGH